MDTILDNLNPAQQEAVTNYMGPSLIVAGAGSGKTRVLTSRIAYMIAQGVAPWNILALTFTNKAAAEMRERIDDMVGPRSRYIRMGTFHSIFLRILRAEADKIGYPTAFTIYDAGDTQSLLRAICKELGLADNDKYKPRALAAKISRLKNDLITPAVYEAEGVFTADDAKRGQKQFLDIYKRYAARCKSGGAMDFDDLLVNMVVLLKNHPDVLEKYREQFKFILVDEYQDTNHVQYLIVKALAREHHNICVVGDDSQSIYSFRGARIENILNFRRDFPEAQVYKLEQNYRSTRTIVEAANGVIARNESSRELKKECFSAGSEGERIKLLRAYTDREEAELVAGEVRALGRAGVPWSEIAILYRANALSRGIEESLRRRDIPYKIYRGHSFFDRKEIRDLMGYFRLIVNPADDEAFRRVVNTPARGIGNVTVEKIATAAREAGTSLWAAAAAMEDRKIAAFTSLIKELSLAQAGMSLYEFGREVAIRSGIIGSYRSENTQEGISALENIDELLNSMVSGAPADGVSMVDDVEAGAEVASTFQTDAGEGMNEQRESQPSALGGVGLTDFEEVRAAGDTTQSHSSEHVAEQGRFRPPLGAAGERADARDGGGQSAFDDALAVSPAINATDESRPALTLDEWLQTVALMTDADETDEKGQDRNRVTLMTVHSSKGLEFDHVFIIGLEEELFPSVREGDRSEMEEERRLFYVALTRARKRVFVSHTEMRFVHGQMAFRRPSRFVREIDERFIEGNIDVGSTFEEGRQRTPAGGRGAPSWSAEKYGGSNGPSSARDFDHKRFSASPHPPRGEVANFAEVRTSTRKFGPTPPPFGAGRRPAEQVEHSNRHLSKISATPVFAGQAASANELKVGVRVMHAKFGAGTIEEMDTIAGGDRKVVVAFDDPAAGRKTLLSKFARLEVI